MGLFNSINIASTGLTAQRLRADVIAGNLANAGTTRTPEGGPFRRSRVIFEAINAQPTWNTPFLPKNLDGGIGRGVRVKAIEVDKSTEPIYKYMPGHPDAIKSGERQGYVDMSNVHVAMEMVDLIAASRAYEANVSLINGSKNMFMRALDIRRA